jgi:hypothetical protein
MSAPGGEKRLLCRHCGEVIGVYEPMVVLAHDGPVYTSPASSSELPRAALSFHAECFSLHPADPPGIAG